MYGDHVFVSDVPFHSHECLQIPSNGILPQKERISGFKLARNIPHFLLFRCRGRFTWTVFDSLSLPRRTRVHSGGPMNKNAMSRKKIEQKSPLRVVSDFPLSPPPWKASKKFTFLTYIGSEIYFSPDILSGDATANQGICSLEGDDRTIVRAGSRGKLFSRPALSLFFFFFLTPLSASFSSLLHKNPVKKR